MTTILPPAPTPLAACSLPACSAGCAVGPTYQRARRRRRRPPSRKAAAAGCPPRRRHAGARPLVDAVRRPGARTAWPRRWRYQPERGGGRGRLRAGARAGGASSAPRCFPSWAWTPGANRVRRRAARNSRRQQLPAQHRRQLGAGRVGPPAARRAAAPAPASRPARPTWPRRACRRRASWPPTTSSCASPTPSARCWPRPSTGYERALQITQNRYDAGIVARTDVLQAETQLANAQADPLTLERQRAQLEHAIAVLVGKAPANFSAAPAPTGPAACPTCRPACRRRCCSAGPTSPRPSAAWRRPTSRSASRARPTIPSSA